MGSVERKKHEMPQTHKSNLIKKRKQKKAAKATKAGGRTHTRTLAGLSQKDKGSEGVAGEKAHPSPPKEAGKKTKVLV